MKRTALLALLLVGCATQYQETGWTGGVESNWASPNILMVNAKGNAFANDQRMKDFAILRAAEKSIEAGYRYFVQVESVDTGRTESYTTYSPTTTNFSGYAYGNSVYGTATTTGGPSTTNYYKPGRSAAFKMFERKPPNYRPGQFFDAYSVLNELGPKYIDDFVFITPPSEPSTSYQSIDELEEARMKCMINVVIDKLLVSKTLGQQEADSAKVDAIRACPVDNAQISSLAERSGVEKNAFLSQHESRIYDAITISTQSILIDPELVKLREMRQ